MYKRELHIPAFFAGNNSQASWDFSFPSYHIASLLFLKRRADFPNKSLRHQLPLTKKFS